jgi:hypothetical protein
MFLIRRLDCKISTRPRHRDRAAGNKHTAPSHALRQYATLTGDKAAGSDTLLTEPFASPPIGTFAVPGRHCRRAIKPSSLPELIGIEKVWSLALSGRAS